MRRVHESMCARAPTPCARAGATLSPENTRMNVCHVASGELCVQHALSLARPEMRKARNTAQTTARHAQATARTVHSSSDSAFVTAVYTLSNTSTNRYRTGSSSHQSQGPYGGGTAHWHGATGGGGGGDDDRPNAESWAPGGGGGADRPGMPGGGAKPPKGGGVAPGGGAWRSPKAGGGGPLE